jgi:type IX secretion system PorP/SprF family membrane protein
MFILSLLLLALPAISKQLIAQDIHFSQFIYSPLSLNPAETGNFNGDLRFVGNHKSQWQSFEDAYSTFSASLDKEILSFRQLAFSTGLLLNNDVAGDGDFGTLRVAIPIAFNYRMKSSTIRLGLSPEFVQHGLNFNALYFGNQYSGDQFDPSLPSFELPDVDRFSFFDISAGLSASHHFNDTSFVNIGTSANHLMAPVKSFYNNPKIVLNYRWQIYANAELPIVEDIYLIPALLFMKQGPYQEFNLGSSFRFDFNPLGLRSVYAGLYLRAQDAGIAVFGFDYNHILVQMSYDVNVSGLRTISRGRGGIELSLIYVFKQTEIFTNPPVKKCPDFI